MNEEQIYSAFKTSYESGVSEDDVKMAMIAAGCPFKAVTRLFNKFMVDAGFAISKEAKDELVSNAINGQDMSVEENYTAAVDAIVAANPNINERGAGTMIHAYCRKNELPCFKKAATKSEGKGRSSSFVHRFYDALVANPSMTEEEAHDFIYGLNGNQETSQNVKNYERMYQNARALANRIAAA